MNYKHRGPRDEVAYNSLQTARAVNNYFIARLRMLNVAVRPLTSKTDNGHKSRQIKSVLSVEGRSTRLFR